MYKYTTKRYMRRTKTVPPASDAKTLAPWSSNGSVVFFWKYGVSFTLHIEVKIKISTSNNHIQRKSRFLGGNKMSFFFTSGKRSN